LKSPNNLLRSQSDGTTGKTTSHLTRLSKDAGQVIGYASLRGTLHLGLFAKVLGVFP